MNELVFKGLAVFGALLFLSGLWATWKLLRTARASGSDDADPDSHPDPLKPESGAEAAKPSTRKSSRKKPEPVSAPVENPPATTPVASAPADAAHASADGSDRERLVCLVARHDKVIQSPIAGVYITLGKCFQDIGFNVQRATSLAALEDLLKTGVPGVMGVDCRLGPRTLREIARLARLHPAMRNSVFLFYNAERPEALHPPAVLPHAHFLGLAFASQQVMEILAPAFEFEPVGSESGEKRDSGAIFEGTLSENSLPEILQFLEIGRRTGLLSLEDEHPAGVINFEEGDITSAQTHRHEGVDAVFEILSLNRGKFRFFPGKVTGLSENRISATQVLLHWAQRVDETGEMVARQDTGEINFPF